MDCRVRLAQLDATLGNLAANLDAHRREAERAAADGIDLLLFPELSLTGYFLKDQAAEVALPREAGELAALAELSQRTSLVVGFVERDREGRLYNAVAVLEAGALLHVHRKVHLVNYGMFEESRDLAAGDRFRSFESRLGRFGVLTCEDAWHVGGGYLYFLDGVDALLVPSASPGRGVAAGAEGLASNRSWRTLIDALALHHRSWVLYANRVGFEDGILFGGGSRVVDPFGVEAAALEGLDRGLLDARIDSRTLERARVQTPLLRDERAWTFARELGRRLGATIELPPGDRQG